MILRIAFNSLRARSCFRRPSENCSKPDASGGARTPQRQTSRGLFRIISSGNGTGLVAVEEGWQRDQAVLPGDLQEYASCINCGVEKMRPDEMYACLDSVTNKWQRCRKLWETESREISVEQVDQGQQQSVTKDQILILSSFHKHRSVKAVDLCFKIFIICTIQRAGGLCLEQDVSAHP